MLPAALIQLIEAPFVVHMVSKLKQAKQIVCPTSCQQQMGMEIRLLASLPKSTVAYEKSISAAIGMELVTHSRNGEKTHSFRGLEYLKQTDQQVASVSTISPEHHIPVSRDTH